MSLEELLAKKKAEEEAEAKVIGNNLFELVLFCVWVNTQCNLLGILT